MHCLVNKSQKNIACAQYIYTFIEVDVHGFIGYRRVVLLYSGIWLVEGKSNALVKVCLLDCLDVYVLKVEIIF